VSVFDYSSDSWATVKSDLLCYDFLENDADHSSYQDCNLHVKASAKAHHMTYMKVKASGQAQKKEQVETDSISTSSATLTYTGQSDAGASKFTYMDANKKTYAFDFGLQFYNSSDGQTPNLASSGAYLFVP